jgi:hypothetical protein|nr:MAG TPA: hypothetical protein [Caudoviricetes sp.]
MEALLASVIMIMIMCVPMLIMGVLALIAEYTRNPVIELVEELRKKHHDSNEN